jgi:hypothetical protein
MIAADDANDFLFHHSKRPYLDNQSQTNGRNSTIEKRPKSAHAFAFRSAELHLCRIGLEQKRANSLLPKNSLYFIHELFSTDKHNIYTSLK